MPSRPILMILDNFRIGGIQRLALDQLFALSDLGIPTIACYREVKSTINNPNFLSLEAERIRQKKINIVALPEGNLAQIIFILRISRKQDFELVINHSVGASVILRLVKILTLKDFKIKTFIHQLPTLSATSQRIKRFIYSLTADEIFGYSQAVVNDWNKRVDSTFFSKKMLGWKRPTVLRNGIYLSRLPKTPIKKPKKQNFTRMIFIGRSVAWKNLDFIISSLRIHDLNRFRALLILPSIDSALTISLKNEFGKRVEFEIGRKIEDIEFLQSDINVYPVDYGPKADYIESLSLNCLEMACLGIPSLVSKNGTETWPELDESGLIIQVDWSDQHEFRSVLESLTVDRNFDCQIEVIRELVSIERNIEQIVGKTSREQ